MKPRYVPPRYLVRLPEGERELDALEILKLFRDRKITTVIPVRPVAGGDWRELREDPEFSVALYHIYKQNRIGTKAYAWSIGICLLCFASPLFLFFLSGPLCNVANWQFLFTKLGINMLFMLFPIVTFLDFPGARKDLPRIVWIVVPWINSIVGFCSFRKIIDGMPPEKRRIPRMLNPLLWSILFLFFLATCFAPGTVEGGKVIFSLYALFTILLSIICIPLIREARRLTRLWLEQNPAPEKATGKSKLRSSLFRRDMKQVLRFLPPYLAAIVAMLAMLTLP